MNVVAGHVAISVMCFTSSIIHGAVGFGDAVVLSVLWRLGCWLLPSVFYATSLGDRTGSAVALMMCARLCFVSPLIAFLSRHDCKNIRIISNNNTIINVKHSISIKLILAMALAYFLGILLGTSMYDRFGSSAMKIRVLFGVAALVATSAFIFADVMRHWVRGEEDEDVGQHHGVHHDDVDGGICGCCGASSSVFFWWDDAPMQQHPMPPQDLSEDLLHCRQLTDRSDAFELGGDVTPATREGVRTQPQHAPPSHNNTNNDAPPPARPQLPSSSSSSCAHRPTWIFNIRGGLRINVMLAMIATIAIDGGISSLIFLGTVPVMVLVLIMNLPQSIMRFYITSAVVPTSVCVMVLMIITPWAYKANMVPAVANVVCSSAVGSVFGLWLSRRMRMTSRSYSVLVLMLLMESGFFLLAEKHPVVLLFAQVVSVVMVAGAMYADHQHEQTHDDDDDGGRATVDDDATNNNNNNTGATPPPLMVESFSPSASPPMMMPECARRCNNDACSSSINMGSTVVVTSPHSMSGDSATPRIRKAELLRPPSLFTTSG